MAINYKPRSTQIRRESIDGAPDIILSLSPSGYQLSEQQGPLVTPMETVSTTPSASSSPDELIVPSSQSSLEDCLEIPMEAAIDIPPTSNRFQFAPRVIPNYTIDRSDLPSWLLGSGRLDFVLEVEGGDLWKKLIVTWLRQERRVGFGLDAKIVS